MKLWCFALLAALTVCASAEDLTTKSGVVYKDYSVREAVTDGLVIFHELGGATVPYAELPDDLRAKYKADEDKAAATLKEREEQRKKLEEQRLEFAKQQAEERIRREEEKRKQERINAELQKQEDAEAEMQQQLEMIKRKLGKVEVVQILIKNKSEGGVVAVPDYIYMKESDHYSDSENKSLARIFIVGLDLSKRSDGEILGESFDAYTISCWEIGFQNLEELDGTKRRLRKFTVNRDEAIEYLKQTSAK